MVRRPHIAAIERWTASLRVRIDLLHSVHDAQLPPGDLPGKPLAALLDLQWRSAMRSALSSVLRDGTSQSIDVRLGLPSRAELSRLTFWPVTVLSGPESLVAVHALTPSPLAGTEHRQPAGTP